MTDRLQALRVADAGVAEAQQRLRVAVEQARAQGSSWAEIGDVLGVSRQAAFKRFGAPRDPRDGGRMTAKPTTVTPADVEDVFTRIDAGEYDAVAARMAAGVADQLTRDVVLDTWARAVADTGNLVRCRDTRLELSDGTVIEPGEAVLGTVVGRTVLECEAGRWIGRVAFDDTGQVVGLLVVPERHGPLPF